MDQPAFINWSNGNTVTVEYSSGYLTSSSFNVQLQAGTTYYLVYSNGDSIFSSKDVTTAVNLFYTS